MQNKFDELYMDIAERVAQLSHAERKKVGAVLVRDGNILAFGYNGTPSGFDNECERDNVTKKEVLHAESNAIAKVARSTESAEGSSLYVTLSPCFECAKLIIQSGIKEVYFIEKYRDESAITFLYENKIGVTQIER